jgi:pimeloyl-ACP methyl ester carboxylesterase
VAAGRSLLPRLLIGLTAALLLWVGFGDVRRLKPRHQAEWLEVGGLRVRALRAGHGDTTLVFLHGYGESLLAWRLLLDRFTRHYRVLAIDLPGFGLSDRPTGAYDLTSYTRWLDALLREQTRGAVIVVGHSMGGELAAAMALEHPERIVAAVLIAPAGDGVQPFLTDTTGVASFATRWAAGAIAFVLPMHDSAWVREPDDRLRQLSYDSTSVAARRVLAEFDFKALADRFQDLRQPVLLIWGRQDPTIPFEIGERIAERLPCRRFVHLPTLHRPHQTLPDTVAAEMLLFLSHPECGAR